jgi:hypothetical protein
MKSRKIPMEWMGPPNWRLPSGKALAEFAFEAGFLAPLLLGSRPPVRSRAAAGAPVVSGPGVAPRLADGSNLTKVPR